MAVYKIDTTAEPFSTASWKDVRKLSVYDFVEQTYYGAAGFTDGTYLIPNPREPFYNYRRRHSVYKNFYRAIINAMINPVFALPIKRETDEEMYLSFADNADNAGTPLNIMIKDAITIARNHGVAFVVMDNFAPGSIYAATKAEAIEARELPYIYTMRPQDVHSYKVDSFGNLTDITFWYGSRKVGTVIVPQLMNWSNTDWVLYDHADNKLIEYTRGTHGLGVLPVIPVFDFVPQTTLEELPAPPHYDLATQAFSIYNRESEMRNQEITQAFSILQGPQLDKDAVVGTSNLLSIPNDAKFSFSFVSPDSAQLAGLVSNCQRAIDDLYRIANQAGVIGVQMQQSGVAKEWDFRAQETVLRETSNSCKGLEMALIELFKLYTNTNFEVGLSWPLDFSPNFVNDKITTTMALLDKVTNPIIISKLEMELVRLYWKGDDAKIELIEEMMDGGRGDVGPNDTNTQEPPDPPADEPSPVDAAEAAAINPDTGGDSAVTAPTISLNGAQVTSMVDIVTKVAGGLLPRESGIEMIKAAFALPVEIAEAIMGNAGKGFAISTEDVA